MTLYSFTSLYLDWVNNFVSVEKFAEEHQITIEAAHKIIALGQEIANLDAYE